MTKDLAKRRRIMERSIRLGHCICDPKKPCPCDLLKEQDVCLCAGERPAAKTGPVRLTQLVEKAGCASKIDQASLRGILRGLPEIDDARVLVGVAAGDDAGVFKLDEKHALVQTVDVFSPSVDDPYTFGQVAAANSLSDVYAMGGEPISALSVIGFPIFEVPDTVMHEILRGGIDKMAEAGVPVIGGHSIKDHEIKAGFAVTGLIDPQRIMTNAGARPGDALILTKALGTGILSFAAQIDRAGKESVQAAAESMTTLNRSASKLMLEFGAHACTDVTGFGLMGHLSAMAEASGVDVEITWDDLPLLPGVLEAVGAGIIPGGVERNRESSAGSVDMGEGTQTEMLEVCLDPQTSGGLLIAIEASKAEALVRKLHQAGLKWATQIGRVRSKGTGRIHLLTRGQRPVTTTAETGTRTGTEETTVAKDEDACCSGEESCGSTGKTCCSGDAAPHTESGAGQTEELFKTFMKSVGRPGALDAATKQAMNIALSVLAKCEPCLKTHVAKARSMGFSETEIDEAAWMAISYGGCPVMMFYNKVRGEMDRGR